MVIKKGRHKLLRRAVRPPRLHDHPPLTFGSANHDTRSLLSPLILLNEWSRKGGNGPGTGTSGALGCRQEVVCNQLAICQLDSPPSHAPILL